MASLYFFAFVIGAIASIYYGYGFHKLGMKCSASKEERMWIHYNFYWLIQQFGITKLRSLKVIKPTRSDFPITHDGSAASVFDVLKIVAKQMDIDIERIDLLLFQNLQTKGATSDAGYYHAAENGRFEIAIEENIVKNAFKLVATIAHELAHIKLLGENRITENNEHLTDLTTVFFGFGIINTNAAYQEQFIVNAAARSYATESSTLGYLTQSEFAYALALFSYYRNEWNPSWRKHLSPDVRRLYKINSQFIRDNEASLFDL